MNYAKDGRPFNIREDLRDCPNIKLVYKMAAKKAAVLCLNVQGEPNIGMIVRTASLFGMGQVYIVGRKHYDKRPTVGMYNYIPIHFEKASIGHNSEELDTNHIITFLHELQEKYQLIAIEQSENSVPLQKLGQILAREKPPLFIMGSESNGIPPEILSEIENIVTIPQWGVGRSHNVANAFSMVAWEWAKIENSL